MVERLPQACGDVYCLVIHPLQHFQTLPIPRAISDTHDTLPTIWFTFNIHNFSDIGCLSYWYIWHARLLRYCLSVLYLICVTFEIFPTLWDIFLISVTSEILPTVWDIFHMRVFFLILPTVWAMSYIGLTQLCRSWHYCCLQAIVVARADFLSFPFNCTLCSTKIKRAWNFVRPAPEVTWRIVAIIIRIVLLSPYFCIRGVSICIPFLTINHAAYN